MLTLDPILIDDTEPPLTSSPLSVARIKHLKIVGPALDASNQYGITLVATCTKKGRRHGVVSLNLAVHA